MNTGLSIGRRSFQTKVEKRGFSRERKRIETRPKKKKDELVGEDNQIRRIDEPLFNKPH